MSNLSILSRFYRTSSKAGLRLTQRLHEILIGSMLGDLFAEKPSSKHNTRLMFKQSVVNSDYIYHFFDLICLYCGSVPVQVSANSKLPHLIGKDYFALKFNTLSLACFNIYREMFYDLSGLKRVPINIADHFTQVSLAYWFMDDGYKSPTGYYFCTESFSTSDILVLLDMLQTKFDLDCSVHKTTNGPRIYIKKSSVTHFNSLVRDEIITQFQYKLHHH